MSADCLKGFHGHDWCSGLVRTSKVDERTGQAMFQRCGCYCHRGAEPAKMASTGLGVLAVRPLQGETMTRWHLSDRADQPTRQLADRHYNRQSVGATQFVPPGRCVVLRTAAADAFWVTSWPFAEYVQHAWPGAWVCSAFRNESPHLSSDLIREAVAATRAVWDPPALTYPIVTFVNAAKVRRKRDPGRCFLRAGFVRIGATKGGLLAFGMPLNAMPEPAAALGSQTDLFATRADVSLSAPSGGSDSAGSAVGEPT